MNFIHFRVYFHYSLHFLNIEVWLRTVTDKNSSCMQITRDHADADIPWFWQTGFGWPASVAAPIRMKEQSWSLVNLPLPHQWYISRQIWRIIAGAYEQLLKKERQTSVSILCWITLQNTLYMDFNLLMLMSLQLLLWILKSPPAVTRGFGATRSIPMKSTHQNEFLWNQLLQNQLLTRSTSTRSTPTRPTLVRLWNIETAE